MEELIEYLKSKLKIGNTTFLEKDILLHRILLRLMKTSFKDDYAFKGGTCLTKCYLGYYRFSEDMDFTYIHQEELVGKSANQLRKIFSKKIDEIIELLVPIADELGLDFKAEKGNSRYFMFGGNNKFTTFKIWYKNVHEDKEDFLKLQINFYEVIINEIKTLTAKSLYEPLNNKEFKILFPEYIDILEEVELKAYSLEEIFLEKIRAILTRRGTKSRDYIDVYLLIKKLNLDYKTVKDAVLEKTEFMLVYDKYLENLSVVTPERLVLGDEENLLLEPLDDGFKDFLPEFFEYLVKLEEKLRVNQE
jgi:predicted nucleotidyltransferase component of viral defense system